MAEVTGGGIGGVGEEEVVVGGRGGAGGGTAAEEEPGGGAYCGALGGWKKDRIDFCCTPPALDDGSDMAEAD